MAQAPHEAEAVITVEEKFKNYLANAGLECKDYQVKGVEWCVEHEKKGYEIKDKNNKKIIIRGGILADEMGLGKTMQMLGTIISNMKKDMHTLLVLPKALLDQWKNVIIKTLGHQPLVYHHFTKKQKLEMDEKLKFSPIVITTYGMIRAAQKSPLHEMKWDRIIFDEAHHLRNNSTSEYEGALKLKSPIKWMVTGTPIQNKISDLYSLLDILGVPKSYYKKKDHIAEQQETEHIAQAAEAEAEPEAEAEAEAEAEVEAELKNLRTLTNEIILHRTKASVGLILPTLTSASANIKWQTNEEKKIAENNHTFLNGDKEKEEHDDDDDPEPFVLLKFLRARQMCILAGLNKKKKSISGTNSKTEAVVAKIAERKENGKHKIVFCHFRGEIDFIKKMLTEKHKMEVKVIDGRTPEKERREILQAKQQEEQAKQQEEQAKQQEEQAKQQEKQQEDQAKQQEKQQEEQAKQQAKQDKAAKVLILQIQTGCEGLNLQEYSEVYFVSPHWNPAVEEQAVARCHRIGQKEETQVFRFYMNGFDEEHKTKSLDQYVYETQVDKKELVTKLLW